MVIPGSLGDVCYRTRAKQEADAAAELQRDLARIEELTVEIRQVTVQPPCCLCKPCVFIQRLLTA